MDRLPVVICAGHMELRCLPEVIKVNRCDFISMAAGGQWILYSGWLVC